MLRCGPCGHVVAARFSAFFASHISRISGSSNTRRTVGQLWGPSAPGTHNPQGSPGRNGHIGVAVLLLTKNKTTPGPRGVSTSARPASRRRRPPRGRPRPGREVPATLPRERREVAPANHGPGDGIATEGQGNPEQPTRHHAPGAEGSGQRQAGERIGDTNARGPGQRIAQQRRPDAAVQEGFLRRHRQRPHLAR